MIWDPLSISGSRYSAIVSHISTQVSSVCGHGVVTESNMDEIGRAVECFLEEGSQDHCVDSKYLLILASQALSSMGEKTAARRLVLFGTHLVRPSEWEVTGGEAMWVLDLKQMTLRDDVNLELVFFNSLNVILDSIADVWDNGHGHGALGLRHVCSSAAALLGCEENKKMVRSLAEEIKTLCRGKLDQIARDRKWANAPRIMNLDLENP